MNMNLTDFYNHNNFKNGVAEGAKIIANTSHSNEKQKFNIGDHIISTDESHYKIFAEDNAVITDVQKTCYGYYWYIVEYIYIPKGKKKAIEFQDNFKAEELQKI